MAVWYQLQETLRSALGDTFGLRCGLRDRRFTLMFKRVAQSEAKGLPIVARCRLREILRFALDDRQH